MKPLTRLLAALMLIGLLSPVLCPPAPAVSIIYRATNFFSVLPGTNALTIEPWPSRAPITIGTNALTNYVVYGPAVTITPATNGTASFDLQPSGYRVKIFGITGQATFSVFDTTNTLNLADLIATNGDAGVFVPTSYAYKVKVDSNDTAQYLQQKIFVAGTLTQFTNTNGTVRTLIISNALSAGLGVDLATNQPLRALAFSNAAFLTTLVVTNSVSFFGGSYGMNESVYPLYFSNAPTTGIRRPTAANTNFWMIVTGAKTNILFTDTNVVIHSNLVLTTPLEISSGGTGSNTAAGARLALGAVHVTNLLVAGTLTASTNNGSVTYSSQFGFSTNNAGGGGLVIVTNTASNFTWFISTALSNLNAGIGGGLTNLAFGAVTGAVNDLWQRRSNFSFKGMITGATNGNTLTLSNNPVETVWPFSTEINWSRGHLFVSTNANNGTTIAFTGYGDTTNGTGQIINVAISNAGFYSYSFTNANIFWNGGNHPTATTNAITVWTFIRFGSNIFGAAVTNLGGGVF